MFGKLSAKQLTTRIFILLVILVLLGIARLFTDAGAWGANTLTDITVNQAYSIYTRTYFWVRNITLPIIAIFLIWHGSDILYRILSACDAIRERK